MIQLPITMPGLPSYRESVDRAVSAENLRAAALTTTDPEVLLGLSFLARAGDPVRKELAAMAVQAKSEFANVVAVLSAIIARIDAESDGPVRQADPDNALSHYLQGTLLHVSNRESEGLDAFRTAAACSELRFYDSTTGDALFKALDALNLQGLDRVCALSWTTSRWANFSSVGIQPIYGAIQELARGADRATRSELAEVLITLGGHLFATNFVNRWFAHRAVEAAFVLKTELAADENPAKSNGYAAAVYGLVSPMFSCPGIKEWWNHSPLQLAQHLPSWIHRAFAVADPSWAGACFFGDRDLKLAESDRPAFEAAIARASETAKKLIDAAQSDPDGIFGPYLKGLPRADRQPGSGPVFMWTPVGGLLQKRPDLFQAAAAHEEAMAAVWEAGQQDPSQQNIRRMMDIGWAIQNYANSHDKAFPENLAVLFEQGLLKPPVEAKSLLTGRPYVYVAAGEKNPAKMNDRAQFVLLYDDEPNGYGCYPCVFASCVGSHIRVQDIEEQLRRRGK